MELKDTILQKLNAAFPDIQFDVKEYKGELTLILPKELVVAASKLLKEDTDLSFNMCEDVTAIDWAVKKNRFTMVYQLFSMKNKFSLRLKCNLDESDLSVDSVSSVWKAADWAERETYDMFGIHFNNHPDLRRMYLPEEFEYHPLRKEFPLMGIPGSFNLPKK